MWILSLSCKLETNCCWGLHCKFVMHLYDIHLCFNNSGCKTWIYLQLLLLDNLIVITLHAVFFWTIWNIISVSKSLILLRWRCCARMMRSCWRSQEYLWRNFHGLKATFQHFYHLAHGWPIRGINLNAPQTYQNHFPYRLFFLASSNPLET